MGWDNSFQSIITLPSGATTGARIVLDGAGDRILVYDTDNNLIASIAPTQGIDDQGTPYLEGIVDYSGDEYVQMGFGNLLLGVMSSDPAVQPGEVSIIGDSSRIVLQSAVNADLPDPSFIEIVGGDNSAGTGTLTYPHHEFRGDLWIHQDTTGLLPSETFTLIASFTESGSGTTKPETWHDVTMGTGWAAGPGGSGSYPPLQFRRDGLNNAHLFGTFHATSTTPAAVLGTGLPHVNMTNLGGVSVVGAATRMSSTPSAIPLYVNSAGELRNAALPAIAINDTWMVNAKFPLGDIP